MKCEDFLAAVESKNLWRRWWARAHAANCQNCAEVTKFVGELHRELSQVEPLSGVRRQTWIQTVETAVPARALSPQPGRRYRYVASVGAAAAIVLAMIGLLIWNTTRKPAVSPKELAHKVGGDETTSAEEQRRVRGAATQAVRLIERSSASFLTKRACFTCHTQTLSAMVLRDARKVGIETDEANLQRQYERAIEDQTGTRVDTKGYALWALDIGQRAPDDTTEAMVEYVLNYQQDLGAWQTTVDRPPAEASNFTTNYVALRGVNRYGNAKQREAIAARVVAVKQWLESADAVDTEDQVYRLRLAYELKLPADQVDSFVQKLLSEQNADGGWAQKPGMQPDAYATGSVLVALHEAGGLSSQHSAWLRGRDYLLRTQQPDGSWHVGSRAKPVMEYFESGFPHGTDQFISAFATGWATEALLMSLAQERH